MKLIALIAGALLILTGCTPGPSMTPEDQFVLETIKGYTTYDSILEFGMHACEIMSNGPSGEELVAELHGDGSALDPAELRVAITAAKRHLCP